MEAKLLDKQSVSAKFEVTVPAEEVTQTYDKVLRNVSRQVKVPGFRPGKAPKGVLIQRVGQDALNQEVRDALVELHYPKAVQQLELTPVHAHFNALEPTEGEVYSFEVEVDLYPDFTLPDLNEIIIDNAAPPLTDTMVTEAIAELQSENATLIPVERPVEAGDYVLVETVREGEDAESGSVLPIDLEKVDDAFAAQLIGKAIGDEIELNLGGAQAEDDGEESDEATEVVVQPEVPKLKVVVKDIKEKEKPEADDDLAQTLGFEKWSEVEEKIRENLQTQLDSEAFREQREEFIDKLVEETEVDLPASLVTRRKSSLLNNLAQELQRNGTTLDAYLKNLDETEKRQEFDDELQSSAETGVKRDLVLERLLEDRGTTLSPKEFSDAVQYMAAREGQDVAQFRRDRGQEWLENYRFILSRDKAVRETVRELLGKDEMDTAEVEEEASEDATSSTGEDTTEEE